MMMFSIFFVGIAFIFGGENSLSGYVNPELYWEARGIAYEVDALSSFLSNPQADLGNIEKVISDLGADEFRDREQASQTLAKMGEAAIPYVEKASTSKDPEVSLRAKKILKSLIPKDEDANQMDEWMALYSLAKIDDPNGKIILQKIAEGPESDLLKQAQALLLDKETQPLPEGKKVLSGFPQDTAGIGQLTLKPFASPVLDAIHRSASIQEGLVKLLYETGDIQVHRVSLGVNEGFFTQNEGRIVIRVEMDYSPEGLIKWFTDKRFLLVEAEGLRVLTFQNIYMVLQDERNLLVFIAIKNDKSITNQDVLDLMNGGSELTFPKPLVDLLRTRQKSTTLFAAVVMPEAFDKSQIAPFSGVGKALLQAEMDEESHLLASLQLIPVEAKKLPEIHKATEEQFAKVVGLLESEMGDETKPFREMAATVNISKTETHVQLTATVTSSVVLQILRLFESFQQQRQGMMNRQRQKQMQNNNRMILH